MQVVDPGLAGLADRISLDANGSLVGSESDLLLVKRLEFGAPRYPQLFVLTAINSALNRVAGEYFGKALGT